MEQGLAISDIIRGRLIAEELPYKANDNIAKFFSKEDLEFLTEEVETKVQELLESLVIDTDNDHNTDDTARRVAKMFIHEIFRGRYYECPSVTAFPNVRKYDELYVTGPISIRSTCAHHFMPIRGKCYIGVFPGSNVIGLSKFNRIVEWISSRPQIQEEMTIDIADYVKKHTEAAGIAVLMQAEHFCLSHRGVKEHESDMTTSVMLGRFRETPSLKQEFFSIVNRMK